ncbi:MULTISPECIES: hypothetical protein [unclassified Pseudoalteromonas]|uniref:hypothetical protein n=1 Tax=unclassified Pseudoalteromonas TaxID=194690 RepID=UPI0023595634|nr:MULTISPECIES: hypothetical protein [unclassified Pseudoalteromonas]MCP4056478.1 hypothetical protein [Pseudoalteromonas sp.]MDC9563358.1 hypothetical protein [Pseudoalteromonas sp. GAB2316C]MDC9572160.1 hypothetical protein [Pseudoalteromonas sp. GABNS16A]MDC9583805.1 hypothetical protein [Pseudoalteromonas sp. GABNS16C]MDC9607799.1 hypothetical protein [Pseudoalteromonas sp. GABNS16H]
MSIKSTVLNKLQLVVKHLVGFLKYTLYMGMPFIVLYALGNLIWLVNDEYGNLIFFILVIYLYIGVAQNKVDKDEFKNNSINVSLMVNLWINIVAWPFIRKKRK